jgi:hypothetical protein
MAPCRSGQQNGRASRPRCEIEELQKIAPFCSFCPIEMSGRSHRAENREVLTLYLTPDFPPRSLRPDRGP